MKKIALLFTLVCVGQLYGMEQEQPKKDLGAFEQLPEDVHNVIINMAFATSNTLHQTIETIKAMSALRRAQYDNLKDFTKLVHILADKFYYDTDSVARVYNTSTAHTYRGLGSRLLDIASLAHKPIWSGPGVEDLSYILDRMKQLITEGADVNFSGSQLSTPLYKALEKGNAEAVKLLLEFGAKVRPEDIKIYEKKVANGDIGLFEAKTIKKLLDEAMEKQNNNNIGKLT